MKSISSLITILFFTFSFSFGQQNKKSAEGQPFSIKPINQPSKKDVRQPDATNFNYGVNELKTRSYESALKTFNSYLATYPEDYNAYYNRGLVYYFLDDVEHACMDWKYAAYFDVYHSIRNYKAVCDSSFDLVAYRNAGMTVQPPFNDEKYIANAVNTEASFPGGEEELNKFIRRNLKISSSRQKDFLRSRIVIKFKVKADGMISDPVAMEYERSALSKEALRITSLMPKWIPAMKDGEFVSSEYYYPIINGRDSLRSAYKIFREGIELFEQSRYVKAEEKFTEVLTINYDDEDAYYYRGICYLNLKDTAKACEDWNIRILSCQISVVKLLNKYCGADISLEKLPTIKESGQKIYSLVEEMPKFPGEEDSMMLFIGKNLKYPIEARNKNISGRVYVSFIIDKFGNVRDTKILRGIGGGCDEEALRIVQSMPKWRPGYLNGRPVNVQFNLPIMFADH